MEQKFYRCERCGNIIAMVRDAGAPVSCCGEKTKELIPNTQDAAVEKHLPVYSMYGGKVYVSVGETPHPMMKEHYIEWVSLQTKFGNQRKELQPGQGTRVCFAVCDGDEVEAAFAYCNLHGLWKN